MKIAVKTPNTKWVLDEIAKDFCQYTQHEIVTNFEKADLIWCVDVFSFGSVAKFNCKKVVSFHHLVEESIKEYNFDQLNEADYFIVPNDITKRDMSSRIKKPIYKLPYWLLSKSIVTRDDYRVRELREAICPNNEILIGSFVKDGNGRDGSTPKIAKNPDLFIKILDGLKTLNIKVLLAGYAREYVRKHLDRLQIPYVYYPKCPDLNVLYNCLDWYLVTSKYEGGPQSILEASFRNVKILSTNVGMAPEVLHKDCICNDYIEFVDRIKNNVDHRDYNCNEILTKYMPYQVVPRYDSLFESLL